jgi:glycerol-3-phosphate acyltransferase PlsY
VNIILAVAIGYAIGAAPIIYLVAKSRGLDLRAVGTGNIGAGNMWRHSGARLGVIAIVVEMGKGVLAPSIARTSGLGTGAELAAAVAVVMGQIWPVTLGFQGGRGNGTATGAAFVLSPPAFMAALAIFLTLTWLRVVTFIGNGGGISASRSIMVPIAILVSFTAYALIALAIGAQIAFLAGFAFVFLFLIRRATAPWPPDPVTGEPIERSLLSVLFLDRPTPKGP